MIGTVRLTGRRSKNSHVLDEAEREDNAIAFYSRSAKCNLASARRVAIALFKFRKLKQNIPQNLEYFVRALKEG